MSEKNTQTEILEGKQPENSSGDLTITLNNLFLSNDSLTPGAIKQFKEIGEWDWVKNKIDDQYNNNKSGFIKDSELHRKSFQDGHSIARNLSYATLFVGFPKVHYICIGAIYVLDRWKNKESCNKEGLNIES